jgi:hypothetical protein
MVQLFNQRSNRYLVNLFQPFLSPEHNTTAVTTAEICRTLTDDPFKKHDTPGRLDAQITLVDESLQGLKNPLSRPAVLIHLRHKGAASKLPPVI